jgi:Arc/MetJ-type ribon-helix-helix transcriptional regulator
MKRTAVVLPDEIASRLDLEARQRHVSVAEVVRRALSTYLLGEASNQGQVLLAALGRSGQDDTARNAEEILEREWRDVGRR